MSRHIASNIFRATLPLHLCYSPEVRLLLALSSAKYQPSLKGNSYGCLNPKPRAGKAMKVGVQACYPQLFFAALELVPRPCINPNEEGPLT